METIFEHFKGQDHFAVYAGERWSISMIRKLAAARPAEVDIQAENDDGSLVVHLPLSWMRIRPKRNLQLSDERRAELSNRMKRLSESAKNDSISGDHEEELSVHTSPGKGG